MSFTVWGVRSALTFRGCCHGMGGTRTEILQAWFQDTCAVAALGHLQTEE